MKALTIFRSTRRRQGGQAIALMAIGLSVSVLAAGMVVDGGNAMTQQRATQNATDAAALAGSVVIVEKLGGATRTDADVAEAVAEAFADNGAQMGSAQYIDFERNVVGTVGNGGAIPTGAWGITAHGERTFPTLLAGFAGISSMTAGADATALGGALRGICSAADGCGVMPMTFSIPITTCDGTGRPLRIGVEWPIVGLSTALADRGTGRYESIVPLCKNGPGGVGWLEMGRRQPARSDSDTMQRAVRHSHLDPDQSRQRQQRRERDQRLLRHDDPGADVRRHLP
jgi:hypothetical protein